MNRAELAMRHEIGVDSMAFGRDYPHAEGTWPNTVEYLSDIFRDVPEAEVRAILGENLIGFLGLDRAHLVTVAERIGAPSYRQIADGPGMSPELKAHLDSRCGYSNPQEGDRRIAEVMPMLERDIPRLVAAGSLYS
jgi:hypothetical protein